MGRRRTDIHMHQSRAADAPLIIGAMSTCIGGRWWLGAGASERASDASAVYWKLALRRAVQPVEREREREREGERERERPLARSRREQGSGSSLAAGSDRWAAKARRKQNYLDVRELKVEHLHHAHLLQRNDLPDQLLSPQPAQARAVDHLDHNSKCTRMINVNLIRTQNLPELIILEYVICSPGKNTCQGLLVKAAAAAKKMKKNEKKKCTSDSLGVGGVASNKPISGNTSGWSSG
ncbi:hypothetical protein T492DRAFT_408663 [Pavlovales sp. CCMP2436]|nr:hypothetical protein T492DRAFT_408663 [Pavlovales sp. CCMP2436]